MTTVESSKRAAWQHPPGWPIVEPGLLMIGIDDVMFVRTSDALSEPVFQRHLRELARAIDLRSSGHRIGVVYDSPASTPTDARRRRESAALLDARKTKLAETTAGFAMASPSPVLRGVLRAVFWLAPPPYPWTVTDDVDGALRWLGVKLPGMDAAAVGRRYAQAVREHGVR